MTTNIATPAMISSKVVTYGNRAGTAGFNCTIAFTVAFLSGLSHKKVNALIERMEDNKSASLAKYKSFASKADDRIGRANVDLNQSYDVIFAQVEEKLNQLGRDRCIAEGRPNDKVTFTDIQNNLTKKDLPLTEGQKAENAALEKATKAALDAAEAAAPAPAPATETVTVTIDIDDILAFINTSEGDELNVMAQAITARMEALANKEAIAA